MRNNQTAIQYMEGYLDLKASYYSRNYLKLLIENAKKIEKKQIREAYYRGVRDEWEGAGRDFEDFYKETYGNGTQEEGSGNN
jgi:hypothetical protein